MADLAPAPANDGGHAQHEGTGVDNRKLGMWVFLSSEFLFFGALITNYMLFRGREFAEGRAVSDRFVRHPIHIHQLVRAVDEFADDGSRALGVGEA